MLALAAALNRERPRRSAGRSGAPGGGAPAQLRRAVAAAAVPAYLRSGAHAVPSRFWGTCSAAEALGW